MAFTFTEIPLSRQQSLEPLSLVFKYCALGEQDDNQVRIYSKAATVQSIFTAWGTVYRQNIEIEPVGWANYTVTVPYGPRPGKQAGDWTFNFDSTGGTLLITAAKKHINDYPPTGAGGMLNPYQGGIGFVPSTGEFQGVEIPVPALKVGYTFRHPEGVVDELLALKLGRATGKTNIAPWRVFAAGEALFMGATGSDGRTAEAEVTYHIVASENATGLSIGNILNIAKRGHEYLWASWRPNPVQNQPGTILDRVYIEQVFPETNFTDEFGWE